MQTTGLSDMIMMGLKLRDEILEAMRTDSPDLAERVRKYGRHLIHRNIGLAVYGIPHIFSTDDLRERLPLEVLENIGDNRFFGAVVGKKSDFIPVGWKVTRMPNNHGRQIRIFTSPDYIAVVNDFKFKNPDKF
jgi:hypothetical protein